MKYSFYSSIEQELEDAIGELFTSVELSTPLAFCILLSPTGSLDHLTKMSYLLKFSPGGSYSHLKPDNDFD
jgi:hypothetical protein